MRSLALLALAVLLLAGCAKPAPEQPIVEAPVAPVVPSGYAFVCPPGANETRDGVCVGRIASLTESNQEPFLAIHPTDPRIMAVGVNAGHTTGALEAGEGGPPSVETIRYDIFFTEDGGASWRLSQMPLMPGPGSVIPVQDGGAGDPAMAFDLNGTLHASILSTRSLNAAGGWGIAYSSTKDLGETWSPPVLFTDDTDNDRNWLSLGPSGEVFVPWQNVGDSSQVAWSLDGGATWQVQTQGQAAEECITVSEVVVLDVPLVACAGYDGGQREGIRLYELDTATGDLTLRAEPEDMECIWPHILETDGLLVMAAEGCGDGAELLLTSSADQGRTWGAPFSVSEESASGATGFYWMAADPWGRVHLIASAGGLASGFVGVTSAPTIEHLALDPAPWAVLQETTLRGVATMQPEAPDSFPLEYGDHYYGMAFHDQGGFVVWTRDRGLDYTRIVPVA